MIEKVKFEIINGKILGTFFYKFCNDLLVDLSNFPQCKKPDNFIPSPIMEFSDELGNNI